MRQRAGTNDLPNNGRSYWARWFRRANRAARLIALRTKLPIAEVREGLHSDLICCGPHHFDVCEEITAALRRSHGCKVGR